MSNQLKTLIVDDEYLALNLVEGFLLQLPDITIIGKVTSPIKALEILQKESVDLLFLDIQMPILSGTNLLKTLKKPPVTILTTAYSEYAIEAFELQVADYLLKPFSFERLLKAVQRAKEMLNTGSQMKESTTLTESRKSINLKSDGKLIKLFYDEILFVEGYGEYVQFVTLEKRITVLQTLKALEETLPKDVFLRVHKSFIINVSAASVIDGNVLEIDKFKIPISRDKRQTVIERIFGNI
ncbi:MAG: LytTR family DNA-binding domain-containing protein [Bacteroidetes bacterium]|nr:LytTR family DNA-binding domain-containing protein [Bacteroidota bacterium]